MAGTAIIRSMLYGFVSRRHRVSLAMFAGPTERHPLNALDEPLWQRCSTSDLVHRPYLRATLHVVQALDVNVNAANRTTARNARPTPTCGTGIDAGDFLAGPSRPHVNDGVGLPVAPKFNTCDAEAGGKAQGEMRPNAASAVRPVLDGTRHLV